MLYNFYHNTSNEGGSNQHGSPHKKDTAQFSDVRFSTSTGYFAHFLHLKTSGYTLLGNNIYIIKYQR